MLIDGQWSREAAVVYGSDNGDSDDLRLVKLQWSDGISNGVWWLMMLTGGWIMPTIVNGRLIMAIHGSSKVVANSCWRKHTIQSGRIGDQSWLILTTVAVAVIDKLCYAMLHLLWIDLLHRSYRPSPHCSRTPSLLRRCDDARASAPGVQGESTTSYRN